MHVLRLMPLKKVVRKPNQMQSEHLSSNAIMSYHKLCLMANHLNLHLSLMVWPIVFLALPLSLTLHRAGI